MNIRLGYVAIPVTLTQESSFKTMTYKRYKELGLKANDALDEIIKENLRRLENILKYNVQNNIYFYRMSHNIIPLATHPQVSFNYIDKYKNEFKKIGEYINKFNIRVDTHPDEFCVLNSENPIVVTSSKKILEFQKELFDAMNIKGMSVIHIGGGSKDKEKALMRFKDNFNKLNKEIKDIIMIENDDRIFNASDTLNLCEELNVPMVLDFHHHKCNKCKNLEKLLPRIINTWKKTTFNPKMHMSSPKSKKEKRSHAEYISFKDFLELLNLLKLENKDIDIMLECKKKDEALFRIIRELKFYKKYHFKRNGIIKIN